VQVPNGLFAHIQDRAVNLESSSGSIYPLLPFGTVVSTASDKSLQGWTQPGHPTQASVLCMQSQLGQAIQVK